MCIKKDAAEPANAISLFNKSLTTLKRRCSVNGLVGSAMIAKSSLKQNWSSSIGETWGPNQPRLPDWKRDANAECKSSPRCEMRPKPDCVLSKHQRFAWLASHHRIPSQPDFMSVSADELMAQNSSRTHSNERSCHGRAISPFLIASTVCSMYVVLSTTAM